MSKKRRNPNEVIARYGFASNIIVGLLALLGVVITAYVTYLTARPQTIGPFDSTQTAQATHTDLIQSPAPLTAVWSETPLAQTGTSMVTLTVLPTSAILAATPSSTMTPVSPEISSQAIACITSNEGTIPAEVRMDSLTYMSISVPAPQLPLENGEIILFRDMQSFEVIEVVQEPPRVRVTITLRNGETITEDVRDATYFFDRLQGQTARGSFTITLAELKRVEFRDQGGCQ